MCLCVWYVEYLFGDDVVLDFVGVCVDCVCVGE